MEATEARGQGFADVRTQAAKCSTQVVWYSVKDVVLDVHNTEIWDEKRSIELYRWHPFCVFGSGYCRTVLLLVYGIVVLHDNDGGQLPSSTHIDLASPMQTLKHGGVGPVVYSKLKSPLFSVYHNKSCLRCLWVQMSGHDTPGSCEVRVCVSEI